MKQPVKRFLFDQPGHYHILVQGLLSSYWSTRLGGMEITVQEPASEPPVTVLTGEVRDQAALIGVLNALYDMRCTVLKVEQIDSATAADAPIKTEEVRKDEKI